VPSGSGGVSLAGVAFASLIYIVNPGVESLLWRILPLLFPQTGSDLRFRGTISGGKRNPVDLYLIGTDR
jgi:hypothetical protein